MRTVIQILITVVMLYVLLAGTRVFAQSAADGAIEASKQIMNIAVSALVEPRNRLSELKKADKYDDLLHWL